MRALIQRRANLVAQDIILMSGKYDSTTETALPWTSLPTEKEKLAWVTTSFRGPFPPHVIYYFLDNESGGDNLMLLSYRDLANFLNGCAPHDIAHHIFHLTRLLVTARYLEDRLQSLFECYRICLRDKRRAETDASNARGELDVAHAALQLSSGQNATSETSGVAQLRAELSAAADFQCQLVLQNDKGQRTSPRVGRAQFYIRNMMLERNATVKDFKE